MSEKLLKESSQWKVSVLSSLNLLEIILQEIRTDAWSPSGFSGGVATLNLNVNSPLQLSSLVLKIFQIFSHCSFEAFEPRFAFRTQTLV